FGNAVVSLSGLRDFQQHTGRKEVCLLCVRLSQSYALPAYLPGELPSTSLQVPLRSPGSAEPESSPERGVRCLEGNLDGSCQEKFVDHRLLPKLQDVEHPTGQRFDPVFN